MDRRLRAFLCFYPASELDTSPNPATRNLVVQAEGPKRSAVDGVAAVDEQQTTLCDDLKVLVDREANIATHYHRK